MRVLNNIKPEKVFRFFEDISKIPHGSGNTKQISSYLVDFAKNKGFEHYVDEMNNVIIIKEASKGHEKSDPVIMQSHMDMVCEKEADCTKDMLKEAIDIKLNGDFISAEGTTLGADDGIGVAYTLAVLDDNNIIHPRIEAVFTVDEEIGMLGAFEIDVTHLKAKRMLNLDCGNEKIMTVSCAGGVTSKSILNLNREEYKGTTLKIKINGISGGHSGVKIHEGGANSNALFGRLLSLISKETDLRIAHIEGGFKDNAIAVETTAVIVADDGKKCTETAQKAKEIFKNEFSVTDPDLDITITEDKYVLPFDKESTNKIISLLTISPNGVQTMSPHIHGLVQTSLNLAILNCTSNIFEAVFSIRSSLETQKDMMRDKLYYITSCLGGKVEISGDYPGWEFKANSTFRDVLSEVYENNFGFKPQIEAVHAGLECGLFAGRIEGLDCVSYGPDMWDVHTPRERLSVSSVERVWNFIVKLLEKLAS